MSEPLYNSVELARLFEEHGLDALVVKSGQSVAYLSGMRFPGTLGRLQDFADSPRAAILIWERSGEATLIVSRIAAGLARRSSWLKGIREFQEYVETPYSVAAAVLEERGLTRARVGVERREIGVERWSDFASRLPKVEFVDCTDLLRAVRNIKTSGEVALLREAALVQDEAYLEVFGSARVSQTERELHARLVSSMLRLGAESAHGMMQSSKTDIVYGGERDVPINNGDVARTDYVCYIDGYPANLSRMAVMGKPSATQEEMYSTLLTIHRETIARMLRSGVRTGEVYTFVRNRLQTEGLASVPPLVGHSLGVWWHQEEPMLIPDGLEPLRPGMVICLEPVLEGFWHLQDELLITRDGPTLLSDRFNTDRLFRMGEGS